MNSTTSPPSLRPAWRAVLLAVCNLLEQDDGDHQAALLDTVKRLRAAQSLRYRHDRERGCDPTAMVCLAVADELGAEHISGAVGDVWGVEYGAAWNSLAALDAVLQAAPGTGIILAEPGTIETEGGGVRVRSAALVQWDGGAAVIPCDAHGWPARLASALADIPAEAWDTEQGVPTPAIAP